MRLEHTKLFGNYTFRQRQETSAVSLHQPRTDDEFLVVCMTTSLWNCVLKIAQNVLACNLFCACISCIMVMNLFIAIVVVITTCHFLAFVKTFCLLVCTTSVRGSCQRYAIQIDIESDIDKATENKLSTITRQANALNKRIKFCFEIPSDGWESCKKTEITFLPHPVGYTVSQRCNVVNLLMLAAGPVWYYDASVGLDGLWIT